MSGEALRCWRAPAWKTIPGLTHGFFGRTGGASLGPFASFNLSERVGDDPHAVGENRRRLADYLAPLRLVLPTQVHGSTIVSVSRHSAAPGEADGLLTEQSGIAVGVLTADCVPVLLVAPTHHVAAVLHAGWRGTAMDIVSQALLRMREGCGILPSAVHAALGPAIDACCYEVGEEVIVAFRRAHPTLPEGIWDRRDGRWRLDLRRANAFLLERAGVPHEQIERVGPCTRCARAECFSHRGAGGATGRELSFIGWHW